MVAIPLLSNSTYSDWPFDPTDAPKLGVLPPPFLAPDDDALLPRVAAAVAGRRCGGEDPGIPEGLACEGVSAEATEEIARGPERG